MIDNWIHYLQLAYIAVINCAGEMAIIVHSGWFVSFTQTHKSQIANCKMPLCVLCYAKGTLFPTHFRPLKVNFIIWVAIEVAGGGEVSTQHSTIMYSPLPTQLMQCEPVMTLIICSYISDYILLCITVTVSDYYLLWLFQIMLAAAESQWSSEAQQPISEWTCTSWAEAVPLPWTSEATPWTSEAAPWTSEVHHGQVRRHHGQVWQPRHYRGGIIRSRHQVQAQTVWPGRLMEWRTGLKSLFMPNNWVIKLPLPASKIQFIIWFPSLAGLFMYSD